MVFGESREVLIAGVVGHPIEHSKSPLLHQAAYAELGLDWTYSAIDVEPGSLRRFIDTLRPQWIGLSVTMPLKEEALALADWADEIAQQTQSANTLLLGENIRAYNTDVSGIVSALAADKFQSALVLGAGATARSAIAACAQLGVSKLQIEARNLNRTETAAALSTSLGMQTAVALLTETEFSNWDLVISTLPATAADPLAVAAQKGTGVLLDVVYEPWPTALARSWGGRRTVSGLEMLAAQAAVQVELMTGRKAPLAHMRAAVGLE